MDLNMGFLFPGRRKGKNKKAPPHPHPLPNGERGRVRGDGLEVFMDRKRLEEAIKKKAKDGRLPCAVCFKIAEDFGISKREMGKILNEMKIKISQCQLGCFK
jgi:hypothetical protein